MNGERIFRSGDGREWVVTFESPGHLLSVAPDLDNTGAMLPQHEVRIVFTSSGESLSEEYTELATLEDLSDADLQEWFEAARSGSGL